MSNKNDMIEIDINNENPAWKRLADMNNLSTKHPTMKCSEIIQDIDTIDIRKASEEVLQWLINNVENYVDNSANSYKLNLMLDDTVVENLLDIKNLKAIQNLYRSIPEDSSDENYESGKMTKKAYDELDKLIARIQKEMSKNETMLTDLFKRLVFYYEAKSIIDGKLIINNIEGSIEIVEFVYENFDVGVVVTDKASEDIVKQYTIPDGFSIYFDICTKKVERRLSIF